MTSFVTRISAQVPSKPYVCSKTFYPFEILGSLKLSSFRPFDPSIFAKTFVTFTFVNVIIRTTSFIPFQFVIFKV